MDYEYELRNFAFKSKNDFMKRFESLSIENLNVFLSDIKIVIQQLTDKHSSYKQTLDMELDFLFKQRENIFLGKNIFWFV